MIQPNELRNGNKLLFLGDIVTFKNITEIREDGIFWIKTFEPKIEAKNFHFKPIPLTEEILLKKCGFENYTGDFLELTITEDLSIIWVGYLGIMIGGSTVFFPEKDKVHELQNLYKELKGEELDINL